LKRTRKAKWTEILANQVVRISGRGKRGKGPSSRQILAGIGLIVMCALFSGWVHIQSITLRYRASRLIELQEDLTQTRAALEIERQMLRSPQRLSRLAERKFGMVIPDVENRVVCR